MRTADTPAEERRAIAASFTAAHAHATQRGGLRHPKRNVAAARIMPLLPALAQLADPHVLLLLPPHRGPSDSSGNAKAARPFSAGSLLMDTQAPEGDARQFVVYDPATSANDAPIIVTDGTPLRHAQSYRFEVRMDPTTHTQRIMVAVPPPSGALSGTSSAPALLMPVSTQFSLSAARIVADPDQVRRARESGRATVDLALPQPPRTVVVERPDLVLVTERANTLLRDIGLSESEADRIGGLTGSMVRAAEAEDMDDHERDDLANLNQA
ncbi:hypothetical protein BC828DRAFT_376726 [Blastocladiella britannica]|nr:hypothetical protein BC828DRAFT_376726 [Blastocladiella britannica]